MADSRTPPLFSVVMPVYGVERYIADAVADVLVQTYADFELIVVDDCAADRSVEVAESVAQGDPRMRIVHHARNCGLSAARNTGLCEARGTWVLFFDPDDRIDAHLLERVHEAIAADSADVILFGHADESFDAQGNRLSYTEIPLASGTFYAGAELGEEILTLEKQTNLGYAWNKAFRLDIIRNNDLHFEDGTVLIEDILFAIAYFKHVQKLSVVPDVLYVYKKRLNTNLTGRFYPNYFTLHRRRIRKIRDFVESCGALDDNAKATLGALYGRFVLSALEQNASRWSKMNRNGRIAWLKNLFEDDLFQELMPYAQADGSRALGMCLDLLRSKNIPALLALGRAIHIVRSRHTGLYMKVKSGR